METNTKNSKDKRTDIESIIKTHVIISMTAGAIPIPLVDFVAITAIQMDMIKQIAEFHSAQFDSNLGKSLASSLIGTSLAKFGASAIKSLPGVGTAIGISSQMILAGGSTHALGRIFDSHFADNSSLSNFNLELMKKKYNELLKVGKDFANDMKKELKKGDIFETIEKLNKLKESGAITEKDFEKTKKDLLAKIVDS